MCSVADDSRVAMKPSTLGKSRMQFKYTVEPLHSGHLSYNIWTRFVAPNATFVCFTTPEIRTPH